MVRKKIREPEYKDWYNSVYGTDHHEDFYSSPEWHKLRRERLDRDHYHCQRCAKRFKSEYLTVHHIVPRSENGPDTIQNLITLCNACHDSAEIEGYRDWASIIGSYQEPEQKQPETLTGPESEDPYHRPEWHKYVYGGQKRSRR